MAISVSTAIGYDPLVTASFGALSSNLTILDIDRQQDRPSDPERLAQQEAEVLRLQNVLVDAEAAYAERKPGYDETRVEYPSVREQEIREIQALGYMRGELQIARAELLHLKGEGPRPKTWVELVDGKMPRNFSAALAEQLRAEIGRLDLIEP